ncbi:MAG: beta-eliminating lyase-related protein [Pseudomonadota bacterium]
MNFASDNVRGVAAPILRALADGMEGAAPAYGADPATGELEPLFADLFGCPVAVLPVATGGAANGLALSALSPPYGGIFCHEEAHIAVDECGAPEFFAGGAKLIPLPGAAGKIDPAALEAAIERTGHRGLHGVKPAALSLTQLTEYGTVYSAAEIGALSAIAKSHGMAVHMDGARFANAVAGLAADPADLTWRAGVDMVSFGATKNGCLMAEAVIAFNPTDAARRDLAYRRKRAGQLVSKHRFLALQLRAYLADGMWLDLARHANRQAARLAEGLSRLPGIDLLYPVDGNEIFVDMAPGLAETLGEKGIGMNRWPDGCWRLVTAFDTDPADVDRALALANEATQAIAGLASGPSLD